MASASSSDDTLPEPSRPSTLSRLFDRWLNRLKSRNGDSSLRQSLEGILGTDESALQELRDEERSMLMNILSLEELRVEDVMVPRADIIAVESTATVADCARMFAEAAHSRLPVYRDVLDDPIGMVHIKDVVGLFVPKGRGSKLEEDPSQIPITRVLRPLLFVPPSMPIVDLFVKMQATRMHMALVIDEYGGTDGLVTIEDLVEEVVGEIEDEHDTALTPHLKRRPDGGYDANGRVSIDELEDTVGISLVDEDDEDIDTLGGLIFSLVGRVPQRGEIIKHPAGLRFEISDADPRRVKRLRIYSEARPPAASQAPSGGDA